MQCTEVTDRCKVIMKLIAIKFHLLIIFLFFVESRGQIEKNSLGKFVTE